MRILLSLCLIITLGSCAGGWTEDDKKKLRSDCMEQADSQIGEDKANKYCDCFTEEMVKAYPVFNDMLEHYQSDTVEKLKEHCRHQLGLP